MAHFAEINKKNEVIRVVVIPNEFELEGDKYLSEHLGLGGTWIQTSYNAKIRNKFAGIGDLYDPDLDIFITKKPFPSWIRDEFGWIAPKPKPEGFDTDWDEKTKSWIPSNG